MSVDPRADAQQARDVFENLVKSLDERRVVINSFITAIEAVADEPRSWSVTLAKDRSFIHLNVGSIPLLGIEGDRLLVSVELGAVSNEVLAKAPPLTDAQGRDRYKSLEPAGMLDVPYGSCAEILPKIEQAMLSAVTLAKQRRTPYWPYHSPGVIDFLEAEVGRSLPRPEHPRNEHDDPIRRRLIDYVRQTYPGWQDLDDPAFVEDEITYKRRASDLARQLLDRDALEALIAARDWDEFRERLLRVANATNLLYRSTPLTGDLAPLHADHIDPADLYRRVFDLLHGESDTPSRIDRFVDWAAERKVKVSWPFLTYFLFLLQPEHEIFVKPRVSDGFLRALDTDFRVSGQMSGEAYDHFRSIMRDFKERFVTLGAKDFIDAQSLLWVIGSLKRPPSPADTKPRPADPATFAGLLGTIAYDKLFFARELVANFLLALQTKRFVILTGISGTGKTKLAQIVAQHFSPEGRDNYQVIAVRPDWTDQRGLLGYYNPLTERYSATPFLHLLLRAEEERRAANAEQRGVRPFFAILDEMNLARVEHYFSDFLSAMESGEAVHLHDVPRLEAGEDPIPCQLPIPPNVYFIGTVNVDESTYMFSPKVLDRAFTIELNRVDLARVGTTDKEGLSLDAMPPTLDGARKPEPKDWIDLEKHVDAVDTIVEINRVLATDNRHFGYRVANEMARFVLLGAKQADSDEKTVRALLDLALLQKVLPKLHGTQQELEELLARLFAFAVDGHPGSMGAGKSHDELDKWQVDQRGHLIASRTTDSEETSPGPPAFPRTAAKLWRMRRRLVQQGFTSFIE